jgi:hypothetical protein
VLQQLHYPYNQNGIHVRQYCSEADSEHDKYFAEEAPEDEIVQVLYEQWLTVNKKTRRQHQLDYYHSVQQYARRTILKKTH